MIRSFFERHFGSDHKIIIGIDYILYFIMIISTMLFTYHSLLHYVALFTQLLFFAYNVFVFIKTKKGHLSFLVFIIPFTISLLFSMVLNGYNSNYNTLISEIAIFTSLTYFAQIVPIKSDCLAILKISLVLFVLYFLALYFGDFYELIKQRNFSDVRFGDKIAPINMITIYFDLACSLSLVAILKYFSKKKIVLGFLFIFAYVVSFACGASTGSKQFFVVTIIVNIISLIWFFGKKRWYISFSIIALMTIIAFVLLSLPAFETIANRFKSMFDLFSNKQSNDYSSAERLFMFEEAVNLFTKKPLFGFGVWGYAINGSFGTYSHNTFSNTLCELGISGFITFMFLMFGPIINYLLNSRNKAINKQIWIIIFCVFVQFFFGVLYLHKMTFIALALLCAELYTNNISNVFNMLRLPNIDRIRNVSIDI